MSNKCVFVRLQSPDRVTKQQKKYDDDENIRIARGNE